MGKRVMLYEGCWFWGWFQDTWRVTWVWWVNGVGFRPSSVQWSNQSRGISLVWPSACSVSSSVATTALTLVWPLSLTLDLRRPRNPLSATADRGTVLKWIRSHSSTPLLVPRSTLPSDRTTGQPEGDRGPARPERRLTSPGRWRCAESWRVDRAGSCLGRSSFGGRGVNWRMRKGRGRGWRIASTGGSGGSWRGSSYVRTRRRSRGRRRRRMCCRRRLSGCRYWNLATRNRSRVSWDAHGICPEQTAAASSTSPSTIPNQYNTTKFKTIQCIKQLYNTMHNTIQYILYTLQ